MKLLIISINFKGGMVQYSQNVINAINTEADIYLSKYCENIFCKKKYKTIPVKLGFVNYVIFLITYFPYLFFKTLFNLLTNKYSAVYILGPFWLDVFYVFIFKLFKKKIYYTVHEGIPRKGVRRYKDIEYCIKNATHIIYLSDYQREKVTEKLKSKAKTIVVHHTSVDDNILLPERPTFFKENPSIVMLGIINEYKGLELLLEALQYVDEKIYNKIYITGTLKVLIPENYNREKIIINDKWISNQELIETILNNELVILPYTEASQSGIATQAICCLKPSIITPVGALPEQYNNKSAFIATETTSQALALAITEACINKEKYNSICKELIDIRNKIDWKYLGKEIDEYLNSN